MKITKAIYRAKCDFPGCRNMAQSIISDNNDPNKKLDLCDDCLTAIYESVAKTVVPKGIDAPFKNQRRLR